MSTLQFTLFFVAILVAYVLVHLRLAKFEAYLKEISVLRQLNDRLSGVSEAMGRIKIDRLEEGLHLLHKELEGLGVVAQRIDRVLGDRPVPPETVAPVGVQTAAERICGVVEERLYQLGYKKPRVLTDLHDVHFEDEVEVQVECERQMMPYKGRVKSRNGRILDVEVHSVANMFP